MGRHAASNDSTVSPPRSNPRALRDLHDDTLASPAAGGSTVTGCLNTNHIPAEPIDAAELIARFRESGLLSGVGRRAAGSGVTGPVNASAPSPLGQKPVLDRPVALKPKPAGSATGRSEPPNGSPGAGPSAPLRIAELLNRHPDIASQSPRTGHRAVTQRPGRADDRTASVFRPSASRPSPSSPSPSIRVAVRPVLTVAAIVTAFALVEAPNLLTSSHAAPGSRTSGAHTSSSTMADSTSRAAGVDIVTTEADLPRHGGMIIVGAPAPGTSTPGTSSGRVSRSARRAIGASANHVPLLKPGQTVPGTWIRPSSGRYTSCFCSRWGSFHAGIDLASKLGTPILAVGDGTVIKAGPASGFGHWVVIQHSNGDVSIYGHMKYFFVHVGQKVKAGEKIALVGDQGFSTGPHLHFEVHKGGLGGTKISPIPWLKARGIVIGPLSKDG